MADPTISKRRRADFVPYEFASSSPEPCLMDPSAPNTEELNKLIAEEDRNLWYLATNFPYLNQGAQTLIAAMVLNLNKRTPFHKLHRFKRGSPYHHLRLRLVRFAGCHGSRAENLFLLTKVDLVSELQEIDLGKEYEPRVVRCDIPDPCERCGTMRARFRIERDSRNTYCGACLGLPGVERRSL